MRVLLVDDSEPFRDLLAQVAVAAGLEVAGTASTGEEGLLLFEKLHPDLVIVDVRLPGLSGFDLADRVREMSPATRVVIVSASESGRDARVIPKGSLTPDRLRAAIGRGERGSVDKL